MRYEGKVLTIGEINPLGKDKIMADMKTFQSFNVYGTSVVTSINTKSSFERKNIFEIPVDNVKDQIDTVFKNIDLDTVKIDGHLTKDLIEVIADRVKKYGINRLVLDTYMINEKGKNLLSKDEKKSLDNELLPEVFLLIINVLEAEVYSGIKIENLDDAKKVINVIYEKGPDLVFIKRCKFKDDITGILFDGERYESYRSGEIYTENITGIDSTFSAAITSSLCKGIDINKSIEIARDFVVKAIRDSTDELLKEERYLYHNVEPLKLSAFEDEALDFDDWFDKNRAIFESELKAEKKFLKDPGKAVSIGVGSGLFASKLDIKYGVEPAKGMAKLAMKRGIEVILGIAENIPLPDDKFDTVLMSTVLSYVKDPQKTVNEAFRILKSGGKIVVSFLAKEGSYAMMYDLAYQHGEHEPEISPEYPYPVKFIRGTKWNSTDQVNNLLNNAGFTDLKYLQTLTRHPKYSNDEVEDPIEGYKKGDFIVIQGVKP